MRSSLSTGEALLVISSISLMITAPRATAQTAARAPTPATSAAGLVGLWGSDRFFGPEVRGELTIIRSGDQWTARISGYTAAVQIQGDTVSFTLPGEHGEFRGHLGRDSKAIRGHWIQPRRVTSGTAYASPLELRALRSSSRSSRSWRGEVVPLDDRLTLYLLVQQQPNGAIQAFFRNPERNFGRGALYDVSLETATLRLTEPKTGQLRFEGTCDPQSDGLTFRLPLVDNTSFQFTRRTPDNAPGFFPRTPAPVRYRYQQPLDVSDGWVTASLEEVGLDANPIAALVQRILDTDSTAARVPLVQGLLIARNGKLVLEEYFFGFSQDRVHDLRSAGKSFSTTLAGMAIDHRARFNLKTPVLSLYPEYRELANPDQRKQAITVEHLLTMSTGLSCEDEDDKSPGNEDRMQSQQQQPDWYKYTLDLPVSHPPGEVAAYCSATINLIGGVLRNATGEWVPELFQKYIAAPLDFGRYYLNLMPTGNAYLGGGIQLRPRDAIKLGQVFLDGGVWNRRRVISQRWVAQATSFHTRLTSGNRDGYNWWLNDLQVGDRVFHTYGATGNGGQVITVVPELKLVVMFTGGNYSNFPMWRKFNEEYLPQYIIPAAMNSRAVEARSRRGRR